MKLTIYSKPGCHLCDEMKAVVAKVANRADVEVEEIDISTDPSLMKEYGEQIPVLLADGRKVAKYRITESQLLRALEAPYAP